MNRHNKDTIYYIDETSKSAITDLSDILLKLLVEFDAEWADLIFLCIGSDRVTGDSLGPMIGHLLTKETLLGAHIYGTLEHPVHALNLEETIDHIHDVHPAGIIVALDASLGLKKHQGYITIGKGSLKPGAGVRKSLPAIGDIFITGIINTSGTFEHLILQTTRLATIMQMSYSISSAIIIASQKYYLKRMISAPDWLPSLLSECAIGDEKYVTNNLANFNTDK